MGFYERCSKGNRDSLISMECAIVQGTQSVLLHLAKLQELGCVTRRISGERRGA